MSEIRPFRGLRPKPELVGRVACPPYDVLSLQESREIAAGNPYSFLHVIRAEIDLDPGADPYGWEVYRRAAANLRGLVADGVLIQDEKPGFYVYRLIAEGHLQHGLVVGASVDEYQSGRIKKHELTRPEKENDRSRHIEMLRANTGLVLLTYRFRQEIAKLVRQACSSSEPMCDFAGEDGVRHTLWMVGGADDISRLQEAFSAVEVMYIADGHHRAASASRVRDLSSRTNPRHTGREAYNHFLAAVFPHSELNVLGYHRVIKDLGGLDHDGFLQRVAEKFELLPTNSPLPEGKRRFGMFLDGTWYRLLAREGTFPEGDPVMSLDVSILQKNLLAPLLGISDPQSDHRIEFVGGIRGIGELEKRCQWDMRVAFALFPTELDELMAVADSGGVLPPKSTWFEPKLRSGMVIRLIDDNV